MTLKELAAMSDIAITPEVAASVLNCNPQAIRDDAMHHPERLGYAISVSGSRTRIPRAPFLRFWGWEGEINGVV